MQGWQQFIAYEDATGVAFDENSYLQFNLAESVSNGNVRVTFTFSDESTRQEWWCLGIGESKDDTSKPFGHVFDNSKYWLKKGLSSVWEDKSGLKITKVTIDNFGTEDLFTYKINGGTFCGQSLTLKKGSANAFGAYGGVFSATAAQTNIFKLENVEVGDYQKIVFKFGEKVPATGGWAYNYQSGVVPPSIPVGAEELDITLDGTTLPELTIFNWSSNPDPINISEVYFYKELTEIDASPIYKAPEGTTDLNDLTGTNTGWRVSYPKKLGQAEVMCGDGHGDVDKEDTHVTITGQDYISFVVTDVEGAGQQLRVWIWDGEAGGAGSTITLYAYPLADYATANWTTANTVNTTGTYVVKVSGYNYLKGVKTNWGGAENTITISRAYVGTGTPSEYVPTMYALSGASTPNASVTAALADANATYYDATGVIGTGIDFTDVANPNALFKANDGVLANSQNVIVGTTCAKLVLADNHPFKAPFDFTATAASYNTTINTTAQAGTLCLPFAATIPAGVDAWTLTYTSGEKATPTPVTTTIPANTPVLLNGSGSKSFTGSSVEVDADATNTSGAMTGVFKQGYVPQNSYVLQSGDEGIGFYKVDAENTIIIKPFRAYLTAQSGGARIFIDFGEDPTGINNVTAKKAEENGAYFNLAGQRVAQPTKGLYIVNGKKVVIK